jgi:hypothetical protein
MEVGDTCETTFCTAVILETILLFFHFKHKNKQIRMKNQNRYEQRLRNLIVFQVTETFKMYKVVGRWN